jgi:hypothetical protein
VQLLERTPGSRRLGIELDCRPARRATTRCGRIRLAYLPREGVSRAIGLISVDWPEAESENENAE